VSATLYGPEFFAGRSETVTRSAAIVVPAIIQLLGPKSVLDVGSGQGEWVQAFVNYGVDNAFGIDISPPTKIGFTRHDLTEPLNVGLTFDLVLCLETGEHLPEDAAGTLVNTIATHANHYVVFGAAVPGQAGKGHINCQPPEWWHAKFAAYGFEAQDILRPLIQHPDVSAWYRDNTWVLVR
jgi:SAM-dependent methyltransferase